MLTTGNRYGWMLIACFAIVLMALVVTSYFLPIQYDICAKNEYTEQKECAAYHVTPFVVLYIGEFLEAHNGTVTSLATCFIAWFTLILWRSTTQQARITDASLNLARDEFNATHRPKLRVRLIRLHTIGGISVHYTVVNVGETQAIIKRHEITLYVQPSPNEFESTQHPFQLDCRELKPGQADGFLSKAVDAEFEYGVAWGRDGGGVLRIRGWIEYDDPLGIQRHTGFLRTYDAKRGRFCATIDDAEEEYED